MKYSTRPIPKIDSRLFFETPLNKEWHTLSSAITNHKRLEVIDQMYEKSKSTFPTPLKDEFIPNDGLLEFKKRTIYLEEILKQLNDADFPDLNYLFFKHCIISKSHIGIHDSYSNEKMVIEFEVHFFNCIFLDEVYFFNVELNKEMSFGQSRFADICRFRKCNAHQSLSFDLCHAISGVRFSSSHAFQSLSFVVVDISNGLNLSYSRFDGSVFISESWIKDGLDFHNSHLDDLLIDLCQCHGKVSFSSTRFKDILDLSGIQFDLSNSETSIDLSDLRSMNRPILQGDLLLSLDQFIFKNRTLRWEGIIAGEHSNEKRSLKISDTIKAALQYNALSGNFAATNQPINWENADFCKSRYLDLRRKEVWLKREPFNWISRVISRIIIGDGIWLRYPFISALVIIMVFGLAYAGFFSNEIVTSGPNNTINSLSMFPLIERIGTGIYFSAITFATVGFGDWHPVAFARLIAACEGLLGMVIMAALTVVLVRRVIR